MMKIERYVWEIILPFYFFASREENSRWKKWDISKLSLGLELHTRTLVFGFQNNRRK